MILLQLPFPPLPVLARNGHGREAVASSHDLLGQAIAVSLLGGQSGVAGEEQKIHVLKRLNAEVAAEWVRAATPFGGAANWRNVPVSGIYEVYCRFFRSFMACYPGCPDLRICPHTDVLPGMAPYEQAVQHLRAQQTYVVGDHASAPPVQTGLHSYSDLLRIYAMGMFSDSVISDAVSSASGVAQATDGLDDNLEIVDSRVEVLGEVATATCEKASMEASSVL